MIGLDYSWDTKGSHVTVCFYHPGEGSETSVCSIKICFCQIGIQPNISVIFGRTGRGVVYSDKQA